MFKTGILYQLNLNTDRQITVNQGGSSSSKTYSILQVLFTIAMQEPGTVISVVAQDVPNLRRGAYRDAKHIWGSSAVLQLWFKRPNETDRIFTCINGSIIEFVSFQDEQDARGARRDYLYVNECNSITWDIYWQLYMRTRKRVYLDYNPSTRFWCHEELIGKSNVKLLISNHWHNPFLSEEEHRKIESIGDPETYKVYARGLTGKLEGLVYNNWDVVDEIPLSIKREWFGLDFGFTNDPTALIRVIKAQGELWLDEVFEPRTGLTNPDIVKAAKAEGLSRLSDIIGDSAEPKSIEEIRRLGLRCEPALKGPDSVRNGIDILKRYKIHVTRRSTLIRKELGNYRWGKNRQGILQNEPVDLFNHTLDAARYVALNRLKERKQTRAPRATTLPLN